MEQDKNSPAAPQGKPKAETGDGNAQGRLPEENPKTPTEPKADISQVDQQEGQMNNGELGGNFEDAAGINQP